MPRWPGQADFCSSASFRCQHRFRHLRSKDGRRHDLEDDERRIECNRGKDYSLLEGTGLNQRTGADAGFGGELIVTSTQRRDHERACSLLGVDSCKVRIVGPTEFRREVGRTVSSNLGMAAPDKLVYYVRRTSG